MSVSGGLDVCVSVCVCDWAHTSLLYDYVHMPGGTELADGTSHFAVDADFLLLMFPSCRQAIGHRVHSLDTVSVVLHHLISSESYIQGFFFI